MASGTQAAVLFADSFDRVDDRSIDADLSGITDNTGSALAANAVYVQPFLDPANDMSGPDGAAANGGGAQILMQRLELADGSGTSNAYIDHNFTNAANVTSGGMLVSVDVTETSQTTSGQGGGFAIGMSPVDANDCGDAIDAPMKFQDGFTGSQNLATDISVGDFWLVLRGDGTLVWGGSGNAITDADESGLLGSSNVGSRTGTISAIFTFSSFAVGTTVAYEVLYDGAPQGSGSFTWDESNANYIGLDARDGEGVFFDNLVIATWEPPPPSATLTVDPATVAANATNLPVMLTWTGENLPASATYQVSTDLAVTYPSGGEAGSAAAGAGTVAAVVNGTLGDTTFTIDFLDGANPVASAQATVFRSRPNVLLILLDDMGWSDLGCYGSEIQTPTIDSLAAGGLRYRNFYNTARCSTTRCSLLTGLYTQQAAVNSGASLPDLDSDNNVTIPELLSTTGYRCYMAGKWHLGAGTHSPVSRGYQHVFGLKLGGTAAFADVSGGIISSFWEENNHGFYSTGNTIPAIDWRGRQFHQTDAIGEYTVKFIDYNVAQNDGAPFYIYLPFNAVH